MSSWQLQTAKARFSEVVRAAEKGPQEITVRGKPKVVVLSVEDYNRKVRTAGSMDEFIRRSAKIRVDLDIERLRAPLRDEPDFS